MSGRGGGGAKPSNITTHKIDASRNTDNTGTVSLLGTWSLDQDAVKTALGMKIYNTPSVEITATLEDFVKALMLNVTSSVWPDRGCG